MTITCWSLDAPCELLEHTFGSVGVDPGGVALRVMHGLFLVFFFLKLDFVIKFITFPVLSGTHCAYQLP